MLRRAQWAVAMLTLVVFAGGTASAQDQTQIRLLQAVPGSSFDVNMGDTSLAAGLAVTDVVDLSAQAGRPVDELAVIDVATGARIDIVIAGGTLPTSGAWTLVVHLDENEMVKVTSFQDNATPVDPARGRLSVRHVAALPPIDIVDSTGRPITGLASGNGYDLSVEPGTIDDLSLALTGSEPIVDLPIIEIASGEVVDVYVIGSLDGETFDIITELRTLVAPTTPSASPSDTTPEPGRVDTGMPIESGQIAEGSLWVVLGLASLTVLFLVARRHHDAR